MFPVASDGRNSIRLVASVRPSSGIRIAAVRLARPKTAWTGASNPGTSRLKLLVLGLVKASSAGLCSRIPPM